jgi:hypothetical protein
MPGRCQPLLDARKSSVLIPAWVAAMICAQSPSPNFAIAARSPARTALNGSFFFQSGCFGASSCTRSSANIACVYSGCDTHSVPSWSNVAMRSSGDTKRGLPWSVVA